MTTNVHLRLIVGRLNDSRFKGMEPSSFRKQHRNAACQRLNFVVFVGVEAFTVAVCFRLILLPELQLLLLLFCSC